MPRKSVEFVVESIIREKATYFLTLNTLYYSWLLNNTKTVAHIVMDLYPDLEEYCNTACPQSAVCRNRTTMQLTTNPYTPHHKEVAKRVVNTLLIFVDTFTKLIQPHQQPMGAIVPPVVPPEGPFPPDPSTPVYILSPEEQTLLHAIKQSGRISADNAASLLKISRAKAKKILQILVDREMLQVIEEGGVKYYVEIQ